VLNHAYSKAIAQSGGVPIILAYDESAIHAYLDTIHGLLLTGGGDIRADFFGQMPHEKAAYVYPERDVFEIALARAAIPMNIPILGICRGLQLLNVVMGGDLNQHIDGHLQTEPRPQPVHSVEIWGELAKMLGVTTANVNSIHHQCLSNVAGELEVLAKAPDGTIEAAYAPGHPFLAAVQWHPEEMAANNPPCPVAQRVFEKFIEKSITYRKTML